MLNRCFYSWIWYCSRLDQIAAAFLCEASAEFDTNTHVRRVIKLWIKNFTPQWVTGAQLASARCRSPDYISAENGVTLWHSGDFPLWRSRAASLVRADGCRSVGCESSAAPGVDWAGISATSPLLSPSACLSVSPPFVFNPFHSENITTPSRQTKQLMSSAFFYLFYFGQSRIHTTLHSSPCFSPIRHVSRDLHLACVRAFHTRKQVKRAGRISFMIHIDHTQESPPKPVGVQNSRKLLLCLGTKHIIFPHLRWW